MICHFILFVRNQADSTCFYKKVLDMSPSLEVPGMTEFILGPSTILGLMPEKGIKKLLENSIPDPEIENGAPRGEIYLQVSNPEVYFERAIAAGAKILSPLSLRNWGHEAGYLSDLDGHIIVFAQPK